MRRASWWLALYAIAWPGVAARAQDPVPSVLTDPFAQASTFERGFLIGAVVQRNPSLEAARQAARAAAEGVVQASSLDDPVASYSFAPASIGSSVAPFGEVLRLGQQIPYPGTLRRRGEAAAAAEVAAWERIETLRLDLATTASVLYDDYWLVGRALAITEQHLGLLEAFQRIATSRYATGEAPQQAPIQAEVEAAHLLHRQVVLRSERRRLAARLNALLHRDPGASLPPPPERLDADRPTPLPIEGAEAARPEIAELQAEIETLRFQVALKELRKKPDFEVMTSYNSMWGRSDHRWMVGIGLRVPVWRQRLDAAVTEAQARLAAADGRLRALRDTVGAEVESAVASLEEAEQVVRLYRSRVLPAARDQVTAARAGFETGKGSMLALIDAQRSLLAAELSHEEALAGVSKARARADRALGRLPFGLPVSNDPSDPTPSPDEDLP